MTAILWVMVLLALGLAVMVLEVFIPSGGILGFVSVAAILAAVGTAFLQIGAAAGMLVLGVTVVAVPAVLGLAFRWFPETPLGRRVLPPPPDPADVLPDAGRRHRLRELVGRSGLARNELLPWGTVEVGGLVVDAMSESGPIAAGTMIEAVGVQGVSLIVRRVDETPPRPMARPDGGDSRLSPTLEAFDFEDLSPPRA